MCTDIATKTAIAGSAKTAQGWVALNQATITCDHATHLWTEHALRLDFTCAATPGASHATQDAGHIAVELDLASGRVLLEQLREVIAAADARGLS